MKFAICTNEGSREVNEDSVAVIVYETGTCFIAADGLGGHGKGDIASKKAVEAFQKIYLGQNACMKVQMSRAFMQAQMDILEEQKRTKSSAQMKTTAAVLDIRDGNVIWGHIGDTRVYGFARNKVKIRTLDHSIPQLLVRCREIKEKEIRHHPDRNKLLRVLGIEEEEPKYELSEVSTAMQYQAFLLCTDGFWELIVEKDMERLLKKSSSPEMWLEKMSDVIQKNGMGTEMDNFSAIAVFV